MSDTYKIVQLTAELADGRTVQLEGSGTLVRIQTSKRPDDKVPSEKKDLEPYCYWTMQMFPSHDPGPLRPSSSRARAIPPSPNAPKDL